MSTYQDIMAEFGVSEIVARAYVACAPIAVDDATNGNVLLWFLHANLGQLEQLESYVRDRNGRSGWGNMVDPTLAPFAALDWLAQFVGTVTTGIAADADKRAAIQGHSSWQRGTKASMISAVRATLTGTKRVTVAERWSGHAWEIVVWTYTPETPNPAATLAAIISQKPGGDVLIGSQLQPGMTWYDASQQYATWGALVAANPTWLALATRVPSY